MDLETQKLLQLLFITITTSVPNFIIFLCMVHRAAIDFKRRKKNNNNKYSCKQQYGAKPCKAEQATAAVAQCGARRAKHQKFNVHQAQ